MYVAINVGVVKASGLRMLLIGFKSTIFSSVHELIPSTTAESKIIFIIFFISLYYKLTFNPTDTTLARGVPLISTPEVSISGFKPL